MVRLGKERKRTERSFEKNGCPTLEKVKVVGAVLHFSSVITTLHILLYFIPTQQGKVSLICLLMHRRRINTELKSKVVAAVWGTECIQFLAALGRF